jgi:hypothetical protein
MVVRLQPPSFSLDGGAEGCFLRESACFLLESTSGQVWSSSEGSTSRRGPSHSPYANPFDEGWAMGISSMLVGTGGSQPATPLPSTRTNWGFHSSSTCRNGALAACHICCDGRERGPGSHHCTKL